MHDICYRLGHTQLHIEWSAWINDNYSCNTNAIDLSFVNRVVIFYLNLQGIIIVGIQQLTTSAQLL